MKYVLSVALAALFLAGCGEDEVELVKNYTLPDFKSMSIGTAIEGSKICKNITWSKEENGGLKMVKMVCDVDVEPINIKMKESKVERFKSSKQETINTYLDGVMALYESKAYDMQGLLKLANEHCKLSEAKFQEVLKTKGKIEYYDENGLVDCDDKLKEELRKENSNKSDTTIDYIIGNLKRTVYYSQITLDQYDASLGLKKSENDAPSQATVELNFIVNADKSVSLSDKFKLTADGKEDTDSKMKPQNILAGFYERQ